MIIASDTLSGVASVIGAVAWPLVIIALIIALWRVLPLVVENLSGRLQSLSFMGITAGFAQASATPPTPSALPSIKDPQPAAWLSSSVPTLMSFLRDPGREDYAVVDLQQGQSWLTSRLYLFTSLLARMRGVRCVVFVATRSPQSLVGLADPQQLLWALAARQPWLEQAYAQALGMAFSQTPIQQAGAYGQPTDASGKLNEFTATMLVNGFLQDPDIQTQGPVNPWPTMDSVRLPTPSDLDVYEHGTWLDPPAVSTLLGNLLVTTPVIYESADKIEQEQLQAVIRHRPASGQPSFVAVLGPNKEFVRLLDRSAIVDSIAESALRLSQSG